MYLNFIPFCLGGWFACGNWHLEILHVTVNNWEGCLFYVGYYNKWEIDVCFLRELYYKLKGE